MPPLKSNRNHLAPTQTSETWRTDKALTPSEQQFEMIKKFWQSAENKVTAKFGFEIQPEITAGT